MTVATTSTGRWRPTTETDIRTAAAEGRLAETHWLELKARVAPKDKGNTELGRDVASLANDGGMLLIGVGEPADDGDPLLCEPIELDGLALRVESVARQKVDPPLPVTCHEIRSAADPALGWLVVDVPVSGAAPHMVEGRYYGRGDQRKHMLSDVEVHRLHQARDAAAAGVEPLLDDMVARDPVRPDMQHHAHIYLVAEPLLARDNQANLYVDGQWRDRLLEAIDAAMHLPSPALNGEQFSPDLNLATQPHRLADGVALTDATISVGRVVPTGPHGPIQESYVEVAVTDRGGIRITCGGVSMPEPSLSDRGIEAETFTDKAPPVLTHRLLHLAAHLGGNIGYGGPWAFGLHVTRLGHTVASSLRMQASPMRAIYDRDTYRATTTASMAELSSTPGAVTARLTTRLLRGYGVLHIHTGLLSDP